MLCYYQIKKEQKKHWEEFIKDYDQDNVPEFRPLEDIIHELADIIKIHLTQKEILYTASYIRTAWEDIYNNYEEVLFVISMFEQYEIKTKRNYLF